MSELSLDEQLLKAAKNGDTESCMRLIDLGANLEAKDEDGWTSLHRASQHGQTETCLVLLDRGADIGVQDEDGWTALHAATLVGDADTCLALIDRGADPEKKNNHGSTALQWTAQNGSIKLRLTFIAYGADTSRFPQDMQGLTPIEAAARGGFIPRLMTLLEESKADHQALADLALAHGQEEAAAVIRSHVARSQIKSIAKGTAPCLS